MKRLSPPWLILGLALLPVLIATALYLSGWRSGGHTAHGQFLAPPRPLDLSAWPARDHWTLLYRAPAACGAECVKALHGLRMAHLAQGKEQGRVLRLVWTPDHGLARRLTSADPALRVLASADDPLPEADGPAIYLIDPQGRAILRYPENADPGGLRKDLTHLLKHSWVG